MRWAGVATVLAIAALLGGCALPTTSDAVVVGPVELDESPQGRPGRPPVAGDEGGGVPDPPSVDGGPGGRDGGTDRRSTDDGGVDGTDTVVLVDSDGELVLGQRPADLDRPAGAVRALDTLLAPLSEHETDRQVSTAVPPATALVDYRRHGGGSVEVVLSPGFDAPGTETEVQRRVRQVGCTVAHSSAATTIEISVQGRTVAAVEADDCALR